MELQNMKKNFIISLILILLVSSKAVADNLNVQEHPLDFKEAIVIALENNQELMGMKEALSASEKDIGI